MAQSANPDVRRGAHGQPTAADYSHDGDGDAEYLAWTERTRVVLTPIAAPSILGLFGFFVATLMVGAHLAGWYGDIKTPLTLFPFALTFGGIAQLAAAFFSYRARDAVATAVHGAWGSFWIAYGILQLLVATGVLPPLVPGTADPAFGFWFIGIALVTWSAFFASLGDNIGIAAVLVLLAAGSSLAAAGFVGGYGWLQHLAGWVFVASAGVAWYAATAMMMESAWGRTILPMGNLSKDANIPGRKPTRPIEYSSGMPGVKVGQ